jgi:hypothetical protein
MLGRRAWLGWPAYSVRESNGEKLGHGGKSCLEMMGSCPLEMSESLSEDHKAIKQARAVTCGFSEPRECSFLFIKCFKFVALGVFNV